jgi:hypothetical protein
MKHKDRQIVDFSDVKAGDTWAYSNYSALKGPLLAF